MEDNGGGINKGKGGEISVNIDSNNIISTKINQNGNDATGRNGGESLYSTYTDENEEVLCGKGGEPKEKGTTGYAKIIYIYIEEQ